MSENSPLVREGPIKKSVLLFSGGLDSLCYAQVLKPDVLLYVPSGSAYESKETNALRYLRPTTFNRVVTTARLNLSEYERPDFIVPARNAHLVLLASHYGDEIILGRADGDRTLDGSAQFHRQMETLLNLLWDEQHWCAARTFRVHAPFAHMTKGELVASFLHAGGTPQELLSSISCYSSTHEHCGRCSPCIRKRAALWANKIAVPDRYFVSNYWETAEWPAMRERLSSGHRGREDQTVLECASASARN